MSESTTVLIIELVGVCIAIAAGFVHLLEAWPSPWVPLVWMASVLVGFSVYRIGDLVRRRYFPAPEPELDEQEQAAARAKKLSLKWSAVEPNVPTEPSTPQPAGPLQIPGADGNFAGDDLATMGLPQISLGEASDDPTAFLDEDELRPENEGDVSVPADAGIPLFAESTMSLDERTLALKAIEVGDANVESEGLTAPLPRVELADVASDKTEALDVTSIRRSSADSGPTEAMPAVEVEPVEPESEATQVFDEAELRGALGDDDGMGKTQKNPAVPAPRKPFSNPEKAKPFSSRSSSSPKKPSEPVMLSTDGVQMFDAAKLQEMREQLDRQKERQKDKPSDELNDQQKRGED